MATVAVSDKASTRTGPGVSTSALERSESTSSSVTVHPLSNEERKASSSASSSPTFQSTSSSSAHKTNSTTASSMQTADSGSSLQGTKNRNGISSPPLSASRSSAVAKNGAEAGWKKYEHRTHSRESEPSEPRGVNGGSRWNEGRYQDDEDDVYSVHDEESPIQYPPFSEEEKEARRVEQKLEQWAAEEKMRRKAKRSSRSGSTLTQAPSSNRFAKRLSALGSLASSKNHPTLPEPIAAASHDGVSAPYGDYGKRAIAGSSDALVDHGRNNNGVSRWARDGSTSALHDVQESANDEGTSFDSASTVSSSAKLKGKSRELSDPFQDPVQDSTARSKPTPRKPIVTPGRAPTIRHRAQEKVRSQGDGAQMPAIVAVDVDEEQEAQAALDRFRRLEDDPFQSASERAEERNRYTMKKSNSSYTIGSTIEDGSTDGAVPKRKSTSSRFNEIGLDDGEDATGWPGDDDGHSPNDTTPRPSRRSQSPATGDETRSASIRDPPPRGPWWTEWLCGCGTPTDADLEQSGRTMPE